MKGPNLPHFYTFCLTAATAVLWKKHHLIVLFKTVPYMKIPNFLQDKLLFHAGNTARL